MSTFIISTRTNGEFQFNLHADNDEIILTSEGYTSKNGCLHGVESVKNNAQDDDNYELKTSADEMFYFNLKASNGQVIGTSEMYDNEESRQAGIESIKNNASDAPIDDQTYEEAGESAESDSENDEALVSNEEGDADIDA